MHIKTSLIFLKYHIHHVSFKNIFSNYSWHNNIILVSGISCHFFAKKWLFLDWLQKCLNSTWHSRPFTFQSQLTFWNLCFDIPFITTLLNFTVFLKHCLNPIPMFSWYISALNPFLLALFKSHPLPCPIPEGLLQMPLISIKPFLNKAYHNHIFFLWTIVAFTLYAVLLAFSTFFCFFTFHTRICLF